MLLLRTLRYVKFWMVWIALVKCLSSSWLAHLLHCFSERSRASSLWWLVGVTLFQWVHIKATLFKRIYEPCPMTLFFTWFIFCGCNGYFFVCHRFLWQHIFIRNRPFLEGAIKEFRGFLATLFAKYSWQNLDWGKIDLLVDFLNSTYVCEQSCIETLRTINCSI